MILLVGGVILYAMAVALYAAKMLFWAFISAVVGGIALSLYAGSTHARLIDLEEKMEELENKQK